MSVCGWKVGLKLQADTWPKCSAARALQNPSLAAHTQLRAPIRPQGPRRAAAQAPQALFGRLFGGNSMATAPNVEDQKEQVFLQFHMYSDLPNDLQRLFRTNLY